MSATVRAFDHGEGGAGVVVEAGIEGGRGPLSVWLPGSAGFPAEVSFQDDSWRCDLDGLMEMRGVLDLAIKTMLASRLCGCGHTKESHAPGECWGCMGPECSR